MIFDHVDARLRSATEIARAAGFIRAAVERHLAALADAGLVRCEERRWRRA